MVRTGTVTLWMTMDRGAAWGGPATKIGAPDPGLLRAEAICCIDRCEKTGFQYAAPASPDGSTVSKSKDDPSGSVPAFCTSVTLVIGRGKCRGSCVKSFTMPWTS